MAIPYTVKAGDNLSAIAKKFGVPSWQSIYNSPDNATFRAKRPNPNLIYAGDILMVPDLNVRGRSVGLTVPLFTRRVP